MLQVDGVLFARVRDPFSASYGVDDPENGIIQLSQTNLRSEIGKINLDKLFQERQNVSTTIVNQINLASKEWGIECLRYEIKNVSLPEKIKIAMQQQVSQFLLFSHVSSIFLISFSAISHSGQLHGKKGFFSERDPFLILIVLET